MEKDMTNSAQESKRLRPKEGAKPHFVSFFVSIFLTIIAFMAVASGVFEHKVILVMFLILMAIIQVVFQLFIWMHLNQKGHEFPILGIVSGMFVALTAVVALILWPM